ncbi:15171_t:CDS:2 [Funneliformis mosseae]|uniref:15171_t:CDS:1 n=1 Tax=Funneliformis mosseae TaxID=27381 RepID=A0A9N9C2M3_FUNMO|nr:15171_t:CDS:2 [Funneliformis mosseae]
MTIPEWMSNGRQHKFHPTSRQRTNGSEELTNVTTYEERLGSTDGKRSRIKEGRSSGTYRRWKAI